ncbi:hypothetical protein [Pelagibius sp.]|uniref:hypothetical protein n=1 Tax=Pelagibius sp. TaxID=1931238 RepID=UPI00260502F3|nr:hypothetical protein [Pelagibius sp.]
MTETVFYSWQSDLPNNTNRGFIGDCIDRAIKNLHVDLGRVDALRAEEGVKGAPGNVDVAQTIFQRIDACGIFAPDISIVTQEGAKRPMPNPNVMIEYGRATATRGDNRIVPVFNTAFGNWLKDRPFDMRHKNAPLTYHLPEEHRQEQKKAAREDLVKQLKKAFSEIMEAGLLDAEAPKQSAELSSFEPVAPYRGLGGNDFPEPLLGRIDLRNPLQEGDTNAWLRPGPQMFLRLIPTQSDSTFAPLELRNHLSSAGIDDLMGHRTEGTFYYSRNRSGAAAFTIDPGKTREDGKDAHAFGVTQAFDNGEIWGVDTWLLDPERTRAELPNNTPLVAPHLLEEGLMIALSQYLGFARDVLALPLPLRCIAGLREIGNHRLIFRDMETGRSFSDECIEESLVKHYGGRTHRILEPFFTKLWEEFGRRRPQEAFDKWEHAIGFDLDTKPPRLDDGV